MASIPVKIILDVDSDKPIEAKIKGQALSGTEGEGVIGYAMDDLIWINSVGQVVTLSSRNTVAKIDTLSQFVGGGTLIGNSDGIDGTPALTYTMVTTVDGFHQIALEYTFQFAASGTMKFYPKLNGAIVFHGYPQKYFQGIAGQSSTIRMTFTTQGSVVAGSTFTVDMTTSVPDMINGTYQEYATVTRLNNVSYFTTSSGGGGGI